MSKIKNYMKENELTYAEIADTLNMNIAYVYRVLNAKGNSVTKKVKPSSRFMALIKIKYPEFYQIVKEELSFSLKLS